MPASAVSFTINSTFGVTRYVENNCSTVESAEPLLPVDASSMTVFVDGRPTDGGFGRVGHSTYSVSAPGVAPGASRDLVLEGFLDFSYLGDSVIDVPVALDGGCSPLPRLAIQSRHFGVGFKPVRSFAASPLVASVVGGGLTLCSSAGAFPANSAFAESVEHGLTVLGTPGAEGMIRVVADAGAFINDTEQPFRMCGLGGTPSPDEDGGVCCTRGVFGDAGARLCSY